MFCSLNMMYSFVLQPQHDVVLFCSLNTMYSFVLQPQHDVPFCFAASTWCTVLFCSLNTMYRFVLQPQHDVHTFSRQSDTTAIARQNMEPVERKKISAMFQPGKTKLGKVLDSLQGLSLDDDNYSCDDCCSKLAELAKEQKFEVVFVDMSEPSSTGDEFLKNYSIYLGLNAIISRNPYMHLRVPTCLQRMWNQRNKNYFVRVKESSEILEYTWEPQESSENLRYPLELQGTMGIPENLGNPRGNFWHSWQPWVSSENLEYPLETQVLIWFISPIKNPKVES